jgi:hypothetical protein
MMLIIGIAALILAMLRVDRAPAPAVSICVFAACAWYLASKRFAETMLRRETSGLTTTRVQRICILVGSGCLAVAVIGLPDAAFLAGYHGYLKAIRAMRIESHWTPDYDPWHMTAGAAIGIISALYVASMVRYGFGPIIGRKSAVLATSPRQPIRPVAEHEHVSTRG